MNGSWRKVTFFLLLLLFFRARLTPSCTIYSWLLQRGTTYMINAKVNYIAAGVPVPIGNWVGCLTGSRDQWSEPSPNDFDPIVPLSRMKTWLKIWFYGFFKVFFEPRDYFDCCKVASARLVQRVQRKGDNIRPLILKNVLLNWYFYHHPTFWQFSSVFIGYQSP